MNIIIQIIFNDNKRILLSIDKISELKFNQLCGEIDRLGEKIRRDDVKVIEFKNISPCFFTKIRELLYYDHTISSKVKITGDYKTIHLPVCTKCILYNVCPGPFVRNNKIEAIERRLLDISIYNRHIKKLRNIDNVRDEMSILFDRRVLDYVERVKEYQSYPLEFSIKFNLNTERILCYRYVVGIYNKFRDEYNNIIYNFYVDLLPKKVIDEILLIKNRVVNLDNLIFGVGLDDNHNLIYKVYFRKKDNSLLRFTILEGKINGPRYYLFKNKIKSNYLENKLCLKDKFFLKRVLHNSLLVRDDGRYCYNSAHIDIIENNIGMNKFFGEIMDEHSIILTYLTVSYKAEHITLYYLI
ncbi:MAG: hypothetical protein ACP5QK_05875 [Myxococcota bacterium]